jgi:pyruvate/2-oxoglutarate dehydrogenase complex dihydrolipoamide dehydrogenase (E3) component
MAGSVGGGESLFASVFGVSFHLRQATKKATFHMRRFDVFVIGGGGTGSEIAFRLGRERSLHIGLDERGKLGGECTQYGCLPTKVMLRSANVAALARDAERFGVNIPKVEVDFAAVMRRVRSVIDAESGAGAKPLEDLGVTVLMDAARLVGPHEIETESVKAAAADLVEALPRAQGWG